MGAIVGIYTPPQLSGSLLRQVLPNSLTMTITDFAEHLGFSREMISRVLHGKVPISPTLAWRLEQSGIGSAKLWLSLQASYDLWQVKHKKNSPKIRRLNFCTI